MKNFCFWQGLRYWIWVMDKLKKKKERKKNKNKPKATNHFIYSLLYQSLSLDEGETLPIVRKMESFMFGTLPHSYKESKIKTCQCLIRPPAQ